MMQEALNELADTITTEEGRAMQNRMTDFYRLGNALDDCKTPDEVLKYLIVEVETRRRHSYIVRIIGRYRRVKNTYDKEELLKWAVTRIS